MPTEDLCDDRRFQHLGRVWSTEVKLQIYQTSGIVLKPNVHKCTSQELFQNVSTKQNAVKQASLALLASEEH